MLRLSNCKEDYDRLLEKFGTPEGKIDHDILAQADLPNHIEFRKAGR